MTKIILTITGPSGAGKSTLQQRLGILPGFCSLVSHTTRPMRDGEVEGWDYYFVSEETFYNMAEAGEFQEETEYAGNSYGLARGEVEAAWDIGHIPVLVCEPGGLRKLRAACEAEGAKVVSIFLTNTIKTLVLRVLDRGLKKEKIKGEEYETIYHRVKGIFHEVTVWRRLEDWSLVVEEFGENSEGRVIKEIMDYVSKV